MKIDNEARAIVTGNQDRLSDDELDLVVWAISLDLKGDMGLRSNAGVYEVAGNYEPIRPRQDSAGVVTSMYVKKPKGSSRRNEMGQRMMDAAALDREARAVLGEIGRHREVLWRCYVAKFPEGLRASLAAFADLAPLVASTTAATRHRRLAISEGRDKSPNRLSYCQGLSARILKAQGGGEEIIEADSLAMQEICGEAEPVLAEACRVVKASLGRHRSSIRRAKQKMAEPKKAEGDMTAPLLDVGAAAGIGRRLRDCDDGEILTVTGIDQDGDYEVVGEGGWPWFVDPIDVHEMGEPHLPREMFRDGPELICYAWIATKEGEGA